MLIQEVDNSEIVFKCDDVGLWKCVKWWQLMGLRVDSPEQVLCKANRVDLYQVSNREWQSIGRGWASHLEVCLEQQVGGLIDTPLPRLLNGGATSISIDTTLKYRYRLTDHSNIG
jgi:hypothetical protein